MTEALHLANVLASSNRPPLLAGDSSNLSRESAVTSLPVEEAQEEDDGEIACICAYTGDDGATIQCDNCLRWQHISCYYPDPAQVPLEDQKHYCTDCLPQPGLDSRRATELQRRNLEQPNSSPGLKKTIAKSSKKKIKDSSIPSAQANGWPHLHAHDRKSASPRDQPPPAKKPKTSHRSSNSISHASNRKRAGTSNARASPSKSPELNVSLPIPHYSNDFMTLFQSDNPQVETATNLMNNIAVTNSLSDWLIDPEAVGKVTGGLAQSEIFKRWDGRIEDIPGQPEVGIEWVDDERFAAEGIVPRCWRLIVHNQIAQGTLIGELRGRVGHRDEYLHEADGRWRSLYHPEPFVFFHPQLPIYIDARQEGSNFRFVRRSCQPNAELQTIITEGTEYHFCFMAKKDIMAGEEVTLAWQVPDTIRDRINSSLATSGNFQPKVRDYISTWVSNVLANCGPCACDGQSSCLMAHYDRRGMDPPPVAKPARRKRKLPVLDPIAPARSRSASEVRKTEPEDIEADSRSASGSRASASRDITPSGYIPGATAGALHELSEREKKKLMREEEMFRRQAEETGRQQKKKRSSGASALAIPGASSASHTVNTQSQGYSERNGSRANGASKYVDAATSTRPPVSSRSSSGKRKSAAASSATARRSVSASKKPRPELYVDAGVQCDLDDLSKGSRVPRHTPRRRYVSITRRLLERCSLNNLHANTTVAAADATTSQQDGYDTIMNTEPASSPALAIIPEVKVDDRGASTDLSAQESAIILPAKHEDETMTDAPPIEPVKSSEAAPQDVVEPPSSLTEGKAQTNGTAQEARVEQANVDSVQDSHPLISKQDDPPPSEGEMTDTIRPVMHLEMPPPSLTIGVAPMRSATTSFMNIAQSPTAMTPGTFPGPLFSPSVTSAVSPSPIRKKLSLSDYTKRSKARESTGTDSAPTTTLSVLSKEVKELDEPVPENALITSPAPGQDAPEEQTGAQDEPALPNGEPTSIAPEAAMTGVASDTHPDTVKSLTPAATDGSMTSAPVSEPPVAVMGSAEAASTPANT